MRITINSMITITDFSSTELQKVIEGNRYPNPAIVSAKKMKRNFHHLPQYVYTYEQVENEIIVPVGYLDELLKLFPDCEIEDNRNISPADIPTLNGITLRDYQEKAVSGAMNYDQGIIQSGTGSGKTIMGLELIQRKQQRTLILTHSKELMNQWQGEIRKLLKIDCGTIGGGKETQADITIAMLQTLSKRPELLEQLSNNYGLVLIEECHHIPSNTFSKVINKLACKYRYGLTATPHRRDGLHQLINRHIGDIIAKVSDEKIHEVGGILPVTIATVRTGRSYYIDSWNDYLKAITHDEVRNKLIVYLARKASTNIPTLILVDRIEHAEALSKMMEMDHLLIHGKLPAKERKKRMEAIPEHNLTLGTSNLLGEGLDISAWQALILTSPISSRVKLLQCIGRVIRPNDGKKGCYVVDLVDNCPFSYSSYKKRLSIYREKKYTLVERDYSNKSKEVA